MSTVVVNGCPVHFIDNEREDCKTSLLMIHGAGASLDMWPSEFYELPKTRMMALDLPGHGHSPPPGRRSIEQYATVVEAFITTLNLPNPVLLGHSMGSAIAMTIVRRHVVTLAGLILFGASARMPVSPFILEGSINSLNEVAMFISDKGITDAPISRRDVVRRQILATGTMTTFGDFLACSRYDMRASLSQIDVPTLVIAGRQDVLTPLKFSQSLATGLPKSDLVILENVGHYAMLERLELVLASIEGFINRPGSESAFVGSA